MARSNDKHRRDLPVIEQLGRRHPNVKSLEVEYVDALLRWAASGHTNTMIEAAILEDWGEVEGNRQRAIRRVLR